MPKHEGRSSIPFSERFQDTPGEGHGTEMYRRDAGTTGRTSVSALTVKLAEWCEDTLLEWLPASRYANDETRTHRHTKLVK